MSQALKKVVRQLRQIAGRELVESTDRQLLQRFADQMDEEAFTALVRRHGSLVFSVCRRVLHNDFDAEDAFQATFLVLARKAGKQAWQDSIGNWLHGVALRTALKARTARARRQKRENRPAPDARPEQAFYDLRSVLDEELERLPSRYRAPLILCYLEGKTRDEAADELGWSAGSVKGRLERGRDLLRSRLERRGLTLPAVLCAGLLLDSAASAAVPSALLPTTAKAALAFATGSVGDALVAPSVLSLAQGVLNAMLMTKIKISLFTFLFVFLTGWGTSWILETSHAQGPAAFDLGADEQPPVRREGEVRKDGAGGKEGQVRREGEPRKEGDIRREADVRKGPREGERLQPGLISNLDLDKGTIKIKLLGDGTGGQEETYNLTGKDMKVQSMLEGKDLKLSDLAPGIRVYFKVEGQDVTTLKADNPRILAFGQVDPEAREIHVWVERKKTTFNVGPNVQILVNGREGKLQDFSEKQRLILTLSFDQKTLLSIANMQKGGRPEGQREGAPREGGAQPVERPGGRPNLEEGFRRENRVQGVLTDLDAGKGTLQILVGSDFDLKMQSFTVEKDVKVKLLFNERAVVEHGLSELGKPTKVMLMLAADGKSVAGIQAIAPLLRGQLKSVDAAARKLTLEDKTFEIHPEAHIRTRTGKLEDLEPGTPVMLALTPDRQKVVGIMPSTRE